jgi:hypothetical protein
MPTAKAVAGKTLFSPTDHTLILVDFQAQIAFAICRRFAGTPA